MTDKDYKPTNHSAAELAYLGGVAAYPAVGSKIEMVGDWKTIGSTEDKDTGFEIYAVQKTDVREITFMRRGTDNIPNPTIDWLGANAAFSGTRINGRRRTDFPPEN